MNTSNSSTGSVTINIHFAVLVPLVSLLIMTSNMAIIIAFRKIPSLLERPSELLILNLAFADFLTGLALTLDSPSLIISGSWPFKAYGCRLVIALFYGTIHTGLATLLAISVDRFLLIYKQYPQYLKVVSQTHVKITIMVCWSIGVLSVVIEQSLWNVAKKIDRETAGGIDFDKICLVPPRRIRAYSITLFLTLYILPVAIISGLSLAFFCLLLKRLKSNNRLGPGSALSTADVSSSSIAGIGHEDASATAGNDGLRRATTTHKRYLKPVISLLCLSNCNDAVYDTVLYLCCR